MLRQLPPAAALKVPRALAPAAAAAAGQEALQPAHWPAVAVLVPCPAAAGLQQHRLQRPWRGRAGVCHCCRRCCWEQQCARRHAGSTGPAGHLPRLRGFQPCLQSPAAPGAAAAACCRRHCLSCGGHRTRAGLGRREASAARQAAPALQQTLLVLLPGNHQPAPGSQHTSIWAWRQTRNTALGMCRGTAACAGLCWAACTTAAHQSTPASLVRPAHTRTCSPRRCRAGLLWRALPGSRKAAVPGPYMDAGVPARPCGLAVWLTTLLARSSLGDTGCWCWCCCAWLRGEAGATAVDIRLLLGLCSRPPRAGRQLAAAAGLSSAEWEHSTACRGQGRAAGPSISQEEPVHACAAMRHARQAMQQQHRTAHRHPRQQRAQTPPPGFLRARLQSRLHEPPRRTPQWRSGCVQHAACAPIQHQQRRRSDSRRMSARGSQGPWPAPDQPTTLE